MIESGIGKYLLFTVLGMFLMYIILRIIAKPTYKSESSGAFLQLAKTGQALNLVKTNEFRELAKTPEFKNLVRTLADEQITILANTLVLPKSI